MRREERREERRETKNNKQNSIEIKKRQKLIKFASEKSQLKQSEVVVFMPL
jgi:hypothetical protein